MTGLRKVRIAVQFAATRVTGRSILITRLDNLSIYWQEGTRRRMLKDEPELDRIANYESVNEAYVVEDYELVVLVENISIGAAPARATAP